MTGAVPQVRRLADADAFVAHLRDLGVDLPFDAELTGGAGSPLGTPVDVGGRTVGNRFAVLPMEGWDGTPDGRPTDLVRRRWRRFGESGAKLVWGGEAVAVREDGRANPRQLLLDEAAVGPLEALRRSLVDAHGARHGRTDDLVVGLQLTHSGRFAAEPLLAYRHPVLDRRLAGRPSRVLTDDELDRLVDDVVAAAGRAQRAGFDFVDVKACHGYLVHELLSAVDRPGRYGGDLLGRSRFLRSAVEGVRAAAPGLGVGVRLSAYDMVPWRRSAGGGGEPEPLEGAYRHAFGGDGTGLGVDLTEPVELLGLLSDLGVGLVCVSAGSPYYTPHLQRPAFFPPSDGYEAPEDPLVGVARLLDAAARLKTARSELTVVASGLSYLQEWLPHVAQAVVRTGGADLVGLGRSVLSYPDLPADVLAGRPLDRRRLCRTFSDCTTAPRNGLVSGCYPLDAFYKARPERTRLAQVKRAGPRSRP
jgi:2,4-dienoyl-CoA reductase-like NADH-dependent reductase (Old Yellow Enzyme family)